MLKTIVAIALIVAFYELWGDELNRIWFPDESKTPYDVPGFELDYIFHHNTDGTGFHGRMEASGLHVQTSNMGVSVTTKSILKYKRRTVEEIESDWASRLRLPVEDRSQVALAQALGIRPGLVNQHELQLQSHEVSSPNVSDKRTVLSLAEMAANAYVAIPHHGDWTNVSKGWDHEGFGWMSDGIRGYVFTSPDKKLVVLSFKGTSAAVLDDGGPTAPNDKINDNLFFSCCCARISYLWNTVCDCYMGDGNRCDEACVEAEFWRQDRYYRAALEIFANVTALYPTADLWVTGHSLGGVLSSLIGRTHGVPAVTFQAPGDKLAVERLHLPVSPGVPIWDDHIWQFGHTADPIFTGDCTGPSSTCWISGFAMESQCHSGLVCSYDVVKELGWRSSVANHRIHVVIDDIISVYDQPAECVVPEPCSECDRWEFIDPLAPPVESSTTTTTASTTTLATSSTPTHTVTTTEPIESCVTRAWYGRCLSWTTTMPTATPYLF